MKNRLITLIDFSIYSYALAELAARWQEISGAQLTFVHQVTGLFPALVDHASKQEIIKDEKDQALEKLKQFTLEKELKQSGVSYVVTDSHLLNTIAELISENYDDVILVGIRGTGMLKRLLLGNTATMIINEINRTVVAVPDKLCAVPNTACNLIPRRLVISLSYRFPLNEKALDSFLTQYGNVIKELDFITSIDEDREEKAIDYLSSLTEKYGSTFKSSYEVFKGNKHFEQIKGYVKREHDTILVVQKGSRNLTDHLFRRFLINEVVEDGSLPLVVLPIQSIDYSSPD